MQTAPLQQSAPNLTVISAGQEHQAIQPGDFVPLELETRSHVPTNVMCRHLNRKPQTARLWAANESGPLHPLRINGRLAWPVSEIRRVLGVA